MGPGTSPPRPMRRRLLVLALAFDTLCGLAVPAVLPALGSAVLENGPRYERVAGACVAISDEAEGTMFGQPAADVWCDATEQLKGVTRS